MKRLLLVLLSLYLFTVSLLPGANTCVLLDTAAALTHHHEHHSDSGFWDFVVDHYLANEPHHSSGDAHDSLPLHHPHSSAGDVVLFFQAPGLGPASVCSTAAGGRVQPRLVTPSTPGGVGRLCWQPPRA